MEAYLLKSAAILAILFAFYKLVLENTSIHSFKRIYLFGILVASFLIPFITFTSYLEVSPVFYTYTEGTPQIAISKSVETINYWSFVLGAIYGMGVLFFSVKFFRNLFIIIHQIRKNPKYRHSGFINILLSENVIPHTFFSYIFMNKKQFEQGEIPSEVLLHEQTHAIQRHSLDVIFVELLQIVFWFNPLFYFLKSSIKLNHEFLADRAVLKAGAETSEYQKILLAFSSNVFTPALAHSINYLSIKKRFTVMKTRTSKRAIWFRSLLLLPLLSLMIYGFSTTQVITEFKEEANNSSEVSGVLEITIDGNENIYVNNEKMSLEEFDKKITSEDYERTSISTSSKVSIEFGQHLILKLIEKNLTDGMSFCVTADGNTIQEDYGNRILEPLHNYNKLKIKKATEAEITEYNKLAKKYNAIAIEKRVIPLKDLKVLETIYRKMTVEQKTDAEPFPECVPPPPPPPLAPKTPKAPSPENGNLYMAAEAPPAPNSDPVEYIKELAKRGATFYIGPHKYTPDEAIEMVKKSENDVTIDVSKYPIVHLGGC